MPRRRDPRLCTPELWRPLRARWLPMARPGYGGHRGGLFCISCPQCGAGGPSTRSGVPDAPAGQPGRGGPLHRYEMRLCCAHLNYADLRRSPVTWHCTTALRLSAGGQLRMRKPPLFVCWKEGMTPLQELLSRRPAAGHAFPTSPAAARSISAPRASALCSAADGSVPHYAADLTLTLLVPDLFFCRLLAALCGATAGRAHGRRTIT